MTCVLGLPLDEALRLVSSEAGDIEITRTAGVGYASAKQGRERIVRVSEDGRRWTVARFPDGSTRETEEA